MEKISEFEKDGWKVSIYDKLDAQLLQRLEAVDAFKAQYRHDLINTNQIIDLLNDRLKLLRQKYQDAQDVCLSAHAVEDIKQEIKLLNELIRFYKRGA